MGIDVYMSWPHQTKTEREAQMTVFSVEDGHLGYLREAYHGGPYATVALLPEGFVGDGEVEIKATILRRRLAGSVFVALAREQLVYGEMGDAKRNETIGEAIERIFNKEIRDRRATEIAASLSNEQRRAVEQMIATRNLPKVALAFVDFVELAERKEKETGQPVTITVSA
jgi:hypothetical protein